MGKPKSKPRPRPKYFGSPPIPVLPPGFKAEWIKTVQEPEVTTADNIPGCPTGTKFIP